MFHPSFLIVKNFHTRNLLLQGPIKGVLYPWPLSSTFSSVACVGECVSISQWHHRFSHSAFNIILSVLSSFKLPVFGNNASSVNSFCHLGELHHPHFNISPSMSKGPLDLLFLDVWGTAPLLSFNNKRLFICVVNDFSTRMMHLILLFFLLTGFHLI